MGWYYLLLAGLFEVGFTTAMRYTDGFTKLLPSSLVLVMAVISIYLVTRAALTIPLGTAYAVWGALGVIGTVVIGILVYDEPVTFWRMFFLALLILSATGLKLVSNP